MKKTGSPLNYDLNLSSAYYFDDLQELKNYYSSKYKNIRYARDSNSSSLNLEKYFSSLYKNSNSLSFSSGMSAITSSLCGISDLNSQIITFGNFYRKSRSIIEYLNKHFKIKILNFVDYKIFIKWAKKNKLKKNIIFFLEIPSNPFLKIIDIHDIRNRFKNSKIITDLSFAGINNEKKVFKYSDILIFSLTKYVNGHNDALGGQLVIKNKKIYDKIWNYRSTFGGIIDPLSAYLTTRSLKTHDLRLKKMLINTETVLSLLKTMRKIDKIWYPGKFENSNQSERSTNFFKHGGSVITFKTKFKNSIKLINKMKTIKMAPSFGSIDTLIEWPFYMSYYKQPKKILKKLNISEDLVRLSVGCEDIDLICNDLKLFDK